ncbi:phenylalanine--tRNA ligase subunit alpha [Candidatus Daviesbacteria bacterium RIFCSPHIGHO2_02_FULL_39_12]|uniref:Phenylalanine--tRNA ligase alpha subunit n=2 Tax=Candidatus Daviesiibacteriota TaxID=1752718 RepID=A0A1F5JAJ3_9BACT|nr:MAG: phenylalanine--tRNA ligase subunit alpha [Candidatus Daviesbacteria bacterium RIFCSPHIGHO2_02_FULL_39_12]OGE71711.1 MAG: phenylalanine--tRNA ligase subunit alpha [Candidatus Daviesbacteria bacterium RIFCSPLOWO2_02_FULL_38_15]
MEDKIRNIQTQYLNKINQAKSLKELDGIFLQLFGKNGALDLLPKEFSKLSSEERRKVGPLFNQVKQDLEKAINDKRGVIREETYQKLADEKLTFQPLGLEARKRTGHLHPVTQLLNETLDLFSKLGFERFDAPHIDTDEYNFELLNIPEGHPARDLWDTLYINSKIKNQKSKLLLRTHTSNGQVRAMRQLKPPMRVMIIDRCFRYENLDARHEHTLEQFEIVYIDKGVSMANLQYLSEYFFQGILGKDIKARLRPKYYPFVEPGAGVDGLCIFCKGKGCNVCGGTGWLELAGAGMIHPQVLKNGGIDPKEYSGIAWGVGPERMAMLKYGVEDIRLFKSGDLKFLEKY